VILSFGKNKKVASSLDNLISLIEKGSGNDYTSWINSFNHIISQTDRICYQANRDAFTRAVDLLVQPKEDIPVTAYIPQLWNLGISLLWLDFSKVKAVEHEYFFATA